MNPPNAEIERRREQGKLAEQKAIAQLRKQYRYVEKTMIYDPEQNQSILNIDTIKTLLHKHRDARKLVKILKTIPDGLPDLLCRASMHKNAALTFFEVKSGDSRVADHQYDAAVMLALHGYISHIYRDHTMKTHDTGQQTIDCW